MSNSTMHEYWYRIRDLRLYLSSSATVSRQRYHGQVWHVISSPTQNRYFRLNTSAFKVLSLLNGRRTLNEAWELVLESDSQNAPSQGEVIQILNQLFASGLLNGEIPPDTAVHLRMLEREEWQKRKAFLSSIFFPKIPLFDPDKILNLLRPAAALFISWFGALLWLTLLMTAASMLAGHTQDLRLDSSSILTPANLPWLYLCIAFTKLLHECGHGFMCKVLGQASGESLGVHTFGIMLLVFSPLPYIDVSSAWIMKKKWYRVLVGLGGIIVELAIAALAIIVWVQVDPGSPLHSLAYNIMFVCGVSTLLFNGNPLLRYDGYYALCDILEMPNLANRANATLKGYLKRIFYGVMGEKQQYYNDSEKVLFPVYSTLAFCYRLVVFAGISMFVADQLFIVGVIVLVMGLFGLVVRPLYQLAGYLLHSAELRGKRRRAFAVTGSLLLSVAVAVGLIPFNDYDRIDGIVESVESRVIRTATSGFVISHTASQRVEAGTSLVSMENHELRAQLLRSMAEYDAGAYQVNQALANNPTALQVARKQQEALKAGIRLSQEELQELTVFTDIAGYWVADPEITSTGCYLQKGQEIGRVLATGEFRIRCVATQNAAAAIVNEGCKQVEIRLPAGAGAVLSGSIVSIAAVGSKELPSIALSDIAGGNVHTQTDRYNRRLSEERLFDIVIRFDNSQVPLQMYDGQKVVARVRLIPKSLLVQAWGRLLQLLQRKYNI